MTLQNGSGTSFRNAKLQLVAGDLNRVRQAVADKRFDDARRQMSEMAAAPPMAQESFSEYHLYTLGRKTTINNAETKQVSMLEGTGVPVQKRFVVDGQDFYYRNQQHPGAPIKDVVQVYYQFRNEEKAGLGMPMPAGTVRVYQADSKGGIHLAGEDRIGHTPKDETSSSRSATPSTSSASAIRSTSRRSPATSTSSSTRSRCATTRPFRSPSRSTSRLAAPGAMRAVDAHADEDGRVGSAVQRPGGRRGGRDAQISRAGHLLSSLEARGSRFAARASLHSRSTAQPRAASSHRAPNRDPCIRSETPPTGRRSKT